MDKKIYILITTTKDIENDCFEINIVGVYDSEIKLKENFSKLVLNILTDEYISTIQDGFAQMYIEDVEEIKIWYEVKNLNEDY